MKSLIVLMALILWIPQEKIKVWKEKKGLAILEAEHVQNRNDLPIYWTKSTAMQGYTGTGLLRWSGTSYILESFDRVNEERILTYHALIKTEGVYYLKIKGAIFDETEAKILIRINNGEWQNYIVPNNGNITWDTNALSECYPAMLENDYHKIEVAGVSSGFLFDKIALIHESQFKTDTETIEMASFEKLKESGSQYVNNDLFPNQP